MFHELSHWTGHKSRLNREKGNKKDSPLEKILAASGKEDTHKFNLTGVKCMDYNPILRLSYKRYTCQLKYMGQFTEQLKNCFCEAKIQ